MSQQAFSFAHDTTQLEPVRRVPYVAGSETSREAARLLTVERLNDLEALVYAAVREQVRGLTDEECQDLTDLDGSTQRPRRVRLVELGLLVDSGEKRKTSSGRLATVWRVA